MDYIINPWWFYLVQVCGALKDILCIIGAMFLFIGAVFWLVKCSVVFEGESLCGSDKRLLTLSKRLTILGAVVLFLGMLTPTEDTLIKMQIAKFGTYSNSEKALEVIDEKTDALIDAIGSVKED